MSRTFVAPLLVAAAGLAWVGVGTAAPKRPDRAAAERQQAVKAFAAKVVTAFGRQDIDALVELSNTPFTLVPGGRGPDWEEAAVRETLDGQLGVFPRIDPDRHEVFRVQTLADALTWLNPQEARDCGRVLGDEDYVVGVQVQVPHLGVRMRLRLLIRLAAGVPQLAGFGREG